jgi:hypothetical protein
VSDDRLSLATLLAAPVLSRPVTRLFPSLLALLIAWLCCACLPPDDTLYESPPFEENHQESTEPTVGRQRPQETVAFGKAYRWDDGVTLTVSKPKNFRPSEFAVVDKSKRYLRFTVTVANKSGKPIDLGLTYISVQSGNKEAVHVFDYPTGLKGPPDAKVQKGRESEYDVGFGVANPKDIVMEVALHDDVTRPSVWYST